MRSQVFISYSHKDREWLERLQTMLKPLVRKKLAVWDDTKIKAGAKWKDEIQGALAAAKVAVLLVSPNFLESDFIDEQELPPLLEAAEKHGLVILWVYVSSCLFDETEITHYQATHDISRPLDALTPAEQGSVLTHVCKQIKAALEQPVDATDPLVGGSSVGDAAKCANENHANNPDAPLLAPYLCREARPPKASSGASDHLPRRLTPLIGRSREIRAIIELLGRERIVTLVGSPGIGKTSLALEVGRNPNLLNNYDDERLVELERLRKGEDQLILQTIAVALEIQLPPESPLPALVEFLREKRLLLIMDKCEHVVKAVKGVISALAIGCPGVCILATSRQTLRIKDANYPVPPLALPSPALEAKLKADEAGQYDAVALFTESAKRIDHGFVLTDRNAPLVTRICRRLDGIALAIELVAARVNMLSLSQLLDRLEKHFDLLVGSSRDLLHATIDWSYDLLNEKEQALFRSLAIFAGGFTLEAAGAISTEEESVSLDLLESLYDKSLVIAQAAGEGPPDETPKRFRLVEFTREYALQKLVRATELNQVAARHLEFFRRVVQEAEKAVEDTASNAAFAALKPEWENLRAALRWALDGGNVIAGAALTASFEWLSFWFGSSTEGIGRVNAFLERIDNQEHGLVARLWTVRAYLEGEIGWHGKSFESAATAVSFARLGGDTVTLIRALAEYGVAGARQREFKAANDALDEADKLAGAQPKIAQRILLLGARGNFLRLSNQLPAALHTYEDRRRIQRTLGDDYGEAMTVLTLAEVEHARGETGQAIALVRKILEGDGTRFGSDLRANLLANLAGYLVAIDDRAGAREAAREAIELCAVTDPRSNCVTWALHHLALVFALEEQWERAARLLGYTQKAFADVGYQLQYTEQHTHDRLLPLLQGRYSEKPLESMIEHGKLLPLARAINEGLST